MVCFDKNYLKTLKKYQNIDGIEGVHCNQVINS